ncbi:MAG: hypothetical protein ACO2ZZ_10445 [Cyclobacteriaceae bacterium]
MVVNTAYGNWTGKVVSAQMKAIGTISTITSSWKRKILLLAFVTAMICVPAIVVIGIWSNISISSILICAGLLVFLIFWFVYQVYPSDQQSIQLVNQQLPQLEYSSQLLEEVETSGLLQVQRQKVEERLANEESKIRYPLPWSMVGFNLFITIFSGVIFISLKNVISDETEILDLIESETMQSISASSVPDSLYLKKLSIVVTPPSYTGIPSYVPQAVDPIVPEGSMVRFGGTFSLTVDELALSLNGKKRIQYPGGKDFSIGSIFKSKTVYQIESRSDTSTYTSPYHLVDIKKDLPPDITVTDMPQYQRFEWSENVAINLKTLIVDDYRIEEAYIVATITEGSGESIRFREQKIYFNEEVSGNRMDLTKSWTAEKFQLGPGNEFYFHVEAIDNKPPSGQLTKSPTYFFAINDTSDVEFSLVGDLGVDMMPEYFKSQLQLIIETEKLIEERNSMIKQEFNHKSNELGFDQKQLRLRYGQFMGEEDESGLEVDQEPEPHSAEPEDETKKISLLDRFGHNTDRENEKGTWQDRGAQPAEDKHDDHMGHGHNHDHGEDDLKGQGGIKDPLEAFIHSHDDAETATFFTVSLKAKLRAALNEMWDAELYLRLFQPEQSLPYQYKALKLLKEIKNHARIYVKRVGFEPIEIKEQETRLTKQPEDFSNTSYSTSYENDKRYAAILALVRAIELLNENSKRLIKAGIWQAAGNELAGLSLEQPGEYLLELNALSKLRKSTSVNDNYIKECFLLKERLIRQFFSSIKSPSVSSESNDELSTFFKNQLLKSGS